MKNKKVLISAGIILAVLLVIVGIFAFNKSNDIDKPKGEQILNRAMEEFVTLDPQIDLNVEVGYIAMHVFDRLVEYDKQGNIYPSLLKEMPKVSADGLTYTFELKPNVKFTNGEKLKSSDVKFTFARMLLPETEGGSTWIFDNVKGAQDVMDGKTKELTGFKIIDDTKFEIQLEKTYTPFIQGLTTPYASIFPQKACEEAGKNWGTAVIGSGPFMVEKWEKGKEIDLIRNDNYFGKKAKLQKIVNKIESDFTQMQAEYDAGLLDLIGITPDKYADYKKDPKYKDNLQVIETLNIRYLTVNNANTILKDKRVRQALSISIDREKLCNVILKESATPAYTFLPKGIDGYDPSAKIEYNAAKAKQLLAEAGYPNGITLDFLYISPNESIVNLMLSIQSMLEQSGIKLNVVPCDEKKFQDLRKAGNFGLSLSNWWADIPDGDNFLYQRFSGYAKYINPEYDKLADQARVETDKAKRIQIYKKLDKMVCQDDWATVPLSHNIEVMLTSPKLKDAYVSTITNLPIFKDAYKE